jgi:peptidoglycan/LPS O-acetylase OafA/YrhL
MPPAEKPQGPARMPALDAVRAIGAVAVLAYHVGFDTGLSVRGLWSGLLARLDVGVAIFFVLSGFLLFRPYVHAVALGRRRPGAGRYLWRRALRILPAYWVTVVVCMTVLPQNRTASTEVWIRHLTLTQIYGRGELRPGLGQTWSLATEATFYLILPVVSILLFGWRWRPVRTIWIVGGLGIVVTGLWLAGSVVGVITPWPQNLWLPTYAAWFSGGMLLAVAHVAVETGTSSRMLRRLPEWGRAPFACWVIAAALLAVASTPLAGSRDLSPTSISQFSTKICLYLLIAILVLLPVAFAPDNRVRAAFGSAPARWLGAISYGLFLWHPFILDWLYRPGGRYIFTGDPLGTFTITLGGSVILASASYYLVERPIQRWGTRWPRRRTGTVIDNQLAVSAASATS